MRTSSQHTPKKSKKKKKAKEMPLYRSLWEKQTNKQTIQQKKSTSQQLQKVTSPFMEEASYLSKDRKGQ